MDDLIAGLDVLEKRKSRSLIVIQTGVSGPDTALTIRIQK